MMSKKQKSICIVLAVLVAAIAVAIVIIKNNAEEQRDIVLNESINLDGLMIRSIQEYSGKFVEDGSDENVKGIFAANVTNCSDRDLEYAEIEMHCAGQTYTFAVSALPAGATALVQDKNKAAFPEEYDDIQANLLYAVYYKEKLELQNNTIEISGANGSMLVKNISNTNINSKVTICYKNSEDGQYLGGIAYRASVPSGLAAGQSVKLSTSHYNPKTCDIIFVSYDK